LKISVILLKKQYWKGKVFKFVFLIYSMAKGKKEEKKGEKEQKK